MGVANPDGTLRKTNKAALARELEKNASAANEILPPSSTMIDGMAMVQKLNASNKTFEQVAELAFSHLTHEGSQSKRIDVVFDVYRRNSIKQAERVNRGADGNTLQYKNLAGGHHVQQWRKFLSSSSNKTSLIRFLSEQNGGQQPGLWRRGARVKTQTWSATGGRDHRRPDPYAKYRRPQARRRTRPDYRPDMSVVFLVPYRGRLKRPHVHCQTWRN